MSEERLCLRCSVPLESLTVNDTFGGSTGASHYRCYHMAHPPRLAHNLSDIIRWPEDQALAREILARFGRKHIAELTAVDEYNFALIEAWKRRIAI